MFWFRIGKILGLISKKTFDEMIPVKNVEKTGLFDKKWYLKQYPDVKKMGINPIKHYLESGWTIGCNPSPAFDNNAYLNDYPDVANAKICPLVHYINHGRYENRIVRSVNGYEKLKIKDVVGEKRTLKEKLSYFFEYPILVQNRYFALKQEVEELKKHK